MTSALIGVIVATPLVARMARRMGAVDDPGGRRVHAATTPRMGGLGLAFGALVGVAAASWVPGIARPGHGPLTFVFVATLGIIILGVIDDLRHVAPAHKLLVQFFLASLCWWGGARVERLGVPMYRGAEIYPLISYLITVAWIVGVTNAINLLDGLDGLAAGVVAIVSATLTLTAIMNGSGAIFLLYTGAALCASCLGFLLFNSHPAKIFMGDTGSLFLGFLIANISILTFQKSTAAAGLGIPILVLGVPLADTFIAFWRRILNGRSPFVGDRHHLHHVLHHLGIAQKFAVVVIHVGTGLLCLSAILSLLYGVWSLGVGVAILTIGLIWIFALHKRSVKAHADEIAVAPPPPEPASVSEDLLKVAAAND